MFKKGLDMALGSDWLQVGLDDLGGVFLSHPIPSLFYIYSVSLAESILLLIF